MSSVDLNQAARRYLTRWQPGDRDAERALARAAEATGHPTEAFCREVADHFEAQPRHAGTTELARQYRIFQQENLRQYQTLTGAGLRVRPWRGAGQPYRGTRHLVESLRRTGSLSVLLTSDRHGPVDPTEDPAPPPAHPMRQPSGVYADGVPLCHNDIFRAVHDAFGHAMFGHSMGPVGELRAAFCHMQMYSPPTHPVLFAEQVSQICWFFYGPHLRTAGGRLPGRGEPGWVPPPERPYPEQKVFACPPELLARFRASFHPPAGTEAP